MPGTVNITTCPVKDVVLGVSQLDQHLVLARRQPNHDDCLVVITEVPPMSRQVIDGSCRCPTRGDSLRVPAPSTGRMRGFFTR
jgi:hypothetical protein